ncbi:hypothetical protein VOLCADRAFT_104915 [Volvox carteri f. nagariensis]|uniref:Uncharacterized protein n=1 Tax=Volvox carteri f. nagariensis TaxID=3068 RepID=D8TX07_VOLCA|nr:uncharacterized protein VOLCADRAFT_104915 [Volvox carteri f. nagariensis]EFJ47828.1 hypothetical protein VOLCADRAFT_104915 [Volvox carteri f. nagariensis]|eukprot:XP_002950934.1 hypothetical protein VOLCADRAFT_104915 [Volvox carteri f. nagariensis]
MRALLRPSLRTGRQAFSSNRQATTVRPLVRTQAYVEASTSYAVLQQAIAYAVVLGAEGVYTRTQLPEGAPGRPEVVPVAGGVATTLLASGLVAANNDLLFTPAFIVGLVSSGAMLSYAVKRTIDTKQDDTDWPGPKVWPATMALISFFALNVFIQAIRDGKPWWYLGKVCLQNHHHHHVYIHDAGGDGGGQEV